MNNINKILYLKMVILGLILSLAAKGEVQSDINKFELSSCNEAKKKCILVTADKAQSGSISANLALKNVQVEIKNQENQVVEAFKNDNGFYDLETNRIILSKLTKGDVLKETVIFMKDLEIKKMEMR